MAATVIAIYKAKDGHKEALMEAIKDHLPLLRAQGLATQPPALLLEAPDGSILEIFDWVSTDAIDKAHSNPAVLALWERFGAVADYRTLGDLSNVGALFPSFTRLGQT